VRRRQKPPFVSFAVSLISVLLPPLWRP